MKITFEFENERLANRLLGRLQQWGYEITRVPTNTDDLEYRID